jgi:hypothetical protein
MLRESLRELTPQINRIAFGGRIVRAGSSRSLRIAFGGRKVRFGLEQFFCSCRRVCSLRIVLGGPIVRVGSPRSLCIALGGGIVRVVAST